MRVRKRRRGKKTRKEQIGRARETFRYRMNSWEDEDEEESGTVTHPNLKNANIQKNDTKQVK